jgi:hypothetical protein
MWWDKCSGIRYRGKYCGREAQNFSGAVGGTENIALQFVIGGVHPLLPIHDFRLVANIQLLFLSLFPGVVFFIQIRQNLSFCLQV